MVLDGENGFAIEANAFEGAIKQGAMGFDHTIWQAVGFDDETVVLAGDFNFRGLEVFDRVIGAAVAVMHFFGFGTQRQRQHLMAEANAEDWQVLFDQGFDGGDGILTGCRGIARAV